MMPSLASRISSNLPGKRKENQFWKFPKDQDLCTFTAIIHSPAHTLVVLKLADDLDVLALLAERFPDGLNVSSLADEGGEDHVNALLHAELQVLQVLVRESGQVDSSSGEVHALLAAQHTAILNGTHQEVIAFRHTQREEHLSPQER